MIKYLLLLSSFLISFNVAAQEEEATVAAVASNSKGSFDLYEAFKIRHGSIEIEELIGILTKTTKTDRDKAEAIYHWITHNIAYNIKLYDEFRSGNRDKRKGKRIRKSEMEEHNAKKIKHTLKKREGICEDYALLFKSLCDAAGLKSKIVKGYIRIDPKKLRSTGEKHVWNLVKIDGQWEAIDATYGAGYLDEYNDFVFDYDHNYFLSNKELFSLNHFPRDTQFQISDTLMVRNQYKNLPIIGRGFFEYEITNFEPLNVMQTVKLGEPFYFTFTSPKNISQFTIYKDKEEEYEVVKRLKEGDDYTVTVGTKNLKTGRILLFGDRQLIAAFRLVVKR